MINYYIIKFFIYPHSPNFGKKYISEYDWAYFAFREKVLENT